MDQELYTQLLTFIGKGVTYGGGTTALAYIAFRLFGKSWIKGLFDKRLEGLKHEHQKELQRLRIQIDSILSGTIKLQEYEFQTLPAAWEKLYKARLYISDLVSPLETYLIFDKLTDEEKEEALSQTDFRESQKERIRKSKDQTSEYREIKFLYESLETRKILNEFNDYISEKGIFLPKELKDLMTQISKLLIDSLAQKSVGRQNQDWETQLNAWKQLDKEVSPLYEQIEVYIHNRLQSHGKTKSS